MRCLYVFFSYFNSKVPSKKAREEEDSEEEGEMEVSELKPKEELEPQRTFSDPDSDSKTSPSRKFREPRACTVKEYDGAVLKQMLNFLLKNLQK